MNPENREVPPEPSWEDINDAVWIVIDAGAAQGGRITFWQARRISGPWRIGDRARVPQGDALNVPLDQSGVSLIPI